jgi:hypothetical protein
MALNPTRHNMPANFSAGKHVLVGFGLYPAYKISLQNGNISDL